MNEVNLTESLNYILQQIVVGPVPPLRATSKVLGIHVHGRCIRILPNSNYGFSIQKFAWLNVGRLMSDITDLRPGTYDCATYSINVVAAALRVGVQAPWGAIDGSA